MVVIIRSFYILFLLIFSISAQATTKQDYGIHGATLKYHKVSNKPYSYNVKGKTYAVKSIDKSKHYKAIGIASYYHQKFHGRRTANGEYFNNNSYTAAHNTLPINTYVLVTNLRNNRKVIVRINDRGPFSKGRIIDLSRLAAQKIGILNSGVAKVKLEALYVHKNGKVTGIGVKSLSKLAKTKDIKEKLSYEDKDLATNDKTKIDSQIEKKATSFFQLRVVGFSSQKSAEKTLYQLSNKYNGHIVKSGNKYDIYFGNLDTKGKIGQLKEKIKKLTRSPQFIVYEYNN
ncbi:hypothetical protein A6A11_02010 [Bisgaardia hudsonensis]|nr:septal ring lytic transglycosylase RlpA family protein [Bisgaardia hudsonensis]QLB13888.1 hypothetical protein A6A11_02010 [Bisgaardia hudsonensis]